jgi:hypothetical protein
VGYGPPELIGETGSALHAQSIDQKNSESNELAARRVGSHSSRRQFLGGSVLDFRPSLTLQWHYGDSPSLRAHRFRVD